MPLHRPSRHSLILLLPVVVALTSAACGQDDPTTILPPPNLAPNITVATARPASVRRSGTARVHVEATDDANQQLILNSHADHGVLVFSGPADAGGGTRTWDGTYTHDGSSDSDAIAITVTDSLGAGTTVTLPITIVAPPSTS